MKTIFLVMQRGDSTEEWEPEIAFEKKVEAKFYINEQMEGVPEEVDWEDFFLIEEIVLK